MMRTSDIARRDRRGIVAGIMLIGLALAAGCASHRDDYGGSNDIGFNPIYGVYNGSFDGTIDSGPGYYPADGYIGPVFYQFGVPL